MESYRLGTFRPHRFGQLSLCEGFGLLPSFEEQEILQSRTGPDYSVEVRVGSTIEDRNFEEMPIEDCLLVSEAIDRNANSEALKALCPCPSIKINQWGKSRHVFFLSSKTS